MIEIKQTKFKTHKIILEQEGFEPINYFYDTEELRDEVYKEIWVKFKKFDVDSNLFFEWGGVIFNIQKVRIRKYSDELVGTEEN